MQPHQPRLLTLDNYATAITIQTKNVEQVCQDLQKSKSEFERLSKVWEREKDKLGSLQRGSAELRLTLRDAFDKRQQQERVQSGLY
tara:strand:- start:276 stop:533 length:258 start_codon:yes stop_codon:yes gene_type:complete